MENKNKLQNYIVYSGYFLYLLQVLKWYVYIGLLKGTVQQLQIHWWNPQKPTYFIELDYGCQLLDYYYS